MITLLLSLALVMIGLIILVAVLALVHPMRDARTNRLREGMGIQERAHSDVGKEEIKRIASEREQQQSLTKPQAAPTMQNAATSPDHHVTHLLCPRCESLVSGNTSLCFHCGAVIDVSSTGRVNIAASSAGNPPAAKPAPSPAPVTLQSSPRSPARNEPVVQLAGDLSAGGQTEAMPSMSSSQVEPLKDRHLKLTVGTLTHPGIKRQYKPNEDCIFAAQGMRMQSAQPKDVGLFIVADGMGGHMFGQEASRLSIQTMIDWILPKVSDCCGLSKVDLRQLLLAGVQAANQVIYQQNRAQSTEMGTTITAALVVDEIAFVANVGDSRTYLYQAAKGLRKITVDHSVVAYLVENGVIQPDDIYIHPQRNQLYRSLGVEGKVPVDVFTVQLQPGDTLLLCSDGLWEMVRDPNIQQILSRGTEASETGHALFKAAMEGGGADNISIIVAQITLETGSRNVAGMRLLTKPETVKMPNMLPGKSKQFPQ